MQFGASCRDNVRKHSAFTTLFINRSEKCIKADSEAPSVAICSCVTIASAHKAPRHREILLVSIYK